MKTVKKFQDGFTLVELMVVVAIIGILSAVAIPNFKKYQAKSKTSEAKLQLASIYSAETAFMADADTYATCLKSMGYDPSAEVGNRYYATGFVTDYISYTNNITCNPGEQFFPAGKIVGGQQATTANTVLSNKAKVTLSGAEFIASAGGYIDSTKASAGANGYDQWTVNQNKYFHHSTVGY